MKICYVCNSSPWTKFHGGGQIFIHNLANHLSTLGHEITVIYTGPNLALNKIPKNNKYCIKWAPYVGYPLTAKLRQINSITILKKIEFWDKKRNFDIINVIGGESLFLPKWCKAKQKCLIFSIEHPDLKAINSILKWTKPFKGFISFLKNRDLIIQKYVCKSANGIVTPSMFTKLEAMKYFKLRSSKIQIIPHGILEEMLKDFLKPHLNKVRGPIVFFGRLEPQKGVDLLLKAYHQLLKKNVLTKQKLIIIGSGPKQKLYRKMANNMAMKNRVYFKGWRPSEYIREILLKASLCVLPSRSESFGLSIAETLAQGVPLVTTLSGSIPEVVDYGRGAWLAKANDVYSLSNTMRVAIENYSESKKKAVFGKNFVRSNFSWAIAAKKYEDFYLKAIKNLE